MAREWTDAQKAAMDTRGRLLLVSAAAGSGKTATLTERIIRRLTDKNDPCELSRLLVVTFTRAAAAELKARISDALSEAIAADPGSRHLQKQLLDISSAQICTIDSFCMDAVSSNFAKLGLPANFRIADSAELTPLSDRVFDELIGKFYEKYGHRSEKDASLFSLLDDNPFADLCDALSSDRTDEDLTTVLRDLYNKLLDYPDGIGRLKREADALREQADGEFLRSDIGRAAAGWKDRFCSSCTSFYREALDLIRQDEEASKALLDAFEDDAGFYERLAAADSLGEILELIGSKPATKVKSKKNLSSDFLTIADKRTFYNDSFKSFPKIFRDGADELRRDMLRTALMCDILYEFLTAYDERMAAEKRQRGICDFTDNRRNLLKLLRDQDGSPSPYAFELRARYDEVYIDEYQDVDEVQDTIFSLIGGDHRFMVGDMKQSIYGFRGADPGIFASYRRRLPLMDPNHRETLPADTGSCIFMSDNFRCDEPVIRFTNTVCGHLFRACADTIGYRDEDELGFGKQVPDGTVPHKVQIDVLYKDKTDDKDDDEKKDASGRSAEEKKDYLEALHIANTVASLLSRGEKLDNGEPIRPEDVAILLRKNTNTKTVISLLNQLGIPAGSAEMDAKWSGFDLLNGPDMRYLVNLLRVFDNPDYDGPLSEVLRAPFPGFSLEDLISIRACDGGSLYDGLLACAGGAGDDAERTARCAETVGWIEGYRRMCMTLPADAILRAMRQDTRIAGRRSKAFLYLYDAARTSRTGSFTGIYDFMRYFEKRIADGKSALSEGKQKREGYVNVMTIHASKGLEFPVVFLAFAGTSFRLSSGDLNFDSFSGLTMKLFDREAGQKYTPSLLDHGLISKHTQEKEDEIRLLYVALTRARERLYVTGTVGEKVPLPFAPDDRFAALAASNYLSWILSVRSIHPELAVWADLNRVPLSAVTMGEPLTSLPGRTDQPEEAGTAAYYRRLLREAPAVSDSEALLRSIPTKVPASRMSDRLLDDCTFLSSDLLSGDEGKLPTEELGFGIIDPQTSESIDRAIRLMESSVGSDFEALLRENSKPTAAEKGTAAHAFLQFCDYAKVLSGGVEAEMLRLLEEGYLNERTAKIADRRMLSAFFDSRFFGLVKGASSVRREFRFARFVPLVSLTDNDVLKAAVGDRTLYVQGSIDLLLTMPDDSVVLCDYKTDRITKEERADPSLLASRMTERHGGQLRQYAEAIREVFGQRPARVYIFSLPLGEAVEIEI
ncbi:MAG: UvrD-helicase domain-containing protein [Clostridia bacterium]|nr:UvrD-helicase domain-containing protein [Clostridia bacterium]